MMKKFGFPLEYLTIFFKEPNQILANYRARCVDQIQQHHPEGIAVIVLPNDVIMFDRIGYHSIAFTSLRDIKEFRGITSAVCDDWVSLTQTIINLGPSDATVKISPILLSEIKPSKTDQRIGSSIEKRSPSTVEGIKNTQSMLDQAVFHQLFLGNGKIMGASEEDSVEIPYVEELLSCFMLDLKKQLPFIQRRQLNEFFGFFETKFLLKFQDVKEISQINLENMAGLPDQGITAIYLVLTKFVEAVRDQAFFIWGQARLREIYQKLTKKSIDGVIADRIRRLTLSSSKELTLLFNVSFIAWLASKYPENPYSSEISDHVGPLLEQLANRVFLAK
jgi:hypothetical protein